MNPKLPFQVRKRYFYALLIFGFVLIAAQFSFHYYFKKINTSFPEIQFIEENSSEILFTEFNPNDLDEEQWKKLGFTDKQVKTILKYKDVVGGKFTSKQQLKKCYAISEEKFKELESFILLPENAQDKAFYTTYKDFESKKLNIKGRFNPNTYQKEDWISLGFSEKQAETILKYKQILGGEFKSKENIKNCFVISKENYHQLSPFLLLPEQSPENLAKAENKKSTRAEIRYTFFDPNTYDVKDWINIGFSEKQANVIVNYRNRNLKGSFTSLEDIEKCFVISQEKFQEMKPWIQLSNRNSSQNSNISTKTPPKSVTDFSKTNLNTINFAQLIEFGFDEKSAAGILGFRKKLGGFVLKKQVLETYDVDKVLAQKLIDKVYLDNEAVKKYTLLDAPEDFLKNHPYFRYYANKIIFFRISYPKEKDIIKKSGIKPEVWEKMKLYLQ